MEFNTANIEMNNTKNDEVSSSTLQKTTLGIDLNVLQYMSIVLYCRRQLLLEMTL